MLAPLSNMPIERNLFAITVAVISALLLASCSRKSDDGGASGRESPAAASSATAPSREGGVQKLVLHALGIEVSAPDCAEATPIDANTASVSPKDPTCVLPFPGAVFAKATGEPASLDAEIENARADSRKLEIRRKQTFSNGWAIAWTAPATSEESAVTGVKAHLEIGGAVITCQWSGNKGDEEADVVWKTCASARKNR